MDEAEKNILRLQNFERQLQAVVMQKQQLQIQLNEIKLSLEALEKVTSGEVYKSIGSILIKTTKEDAKEDLENKKGLIEARVKSLAQQEEKLKSEFQRLQKKLKGELGE